MRRLNVVVIPGDGIGPELTDVAVAVLQATEKGADFSLSLDHHTAGAALYRQIGRSITEETLEACRKADATLLYASRGRGFVTPEVALDTMLMTRRGVERVARKAFDLARGRDGAPADGVRRVTCVDKANVLRGFAFFRQTFLDGARDYPDVEAECRHADATAVRLVQEPGRFDVLVMENFLGDLLSDLGGGTIGGLGMCPSGNLGDARAYFEPVHGSAPDLAGTNRANPLSMVLSAAMMLEWLDEPGAARRMRDAVNAALLDGAITVRADGTVAGGTTPAGRAIAQRLR